MGPVIPGKKFFLGVGKGCRNGDKHGKIPCMRGWIEASVMYISNENVLSLGIVFAFILLVYTTMLSMINLFIPCPTKYPDQAGHRDEKYIIETVSS